MRAHHPLHSTQLYKCSSRTVLNIVINIVSRTCYWCIVVLWYFDIVTSRPNPLCLCVCRLVEFTRSDGTVGRRVRPYIIDLGSGNGTYLNNQRIEPQRYYELKEKDVIKFGFSSREYVLLHEFSDTTEVDAKREEEEDEGLDAWMVTLNCGAPGSFRFDAAMAVKQSAV